MKRLKIPVDEYATPSPYTLEGEASLADASKMMESKGVRHVPVVEAGKVVGIVSQRDVNVALCIDRSGSGQIMDIMTSNPFTVKCDDPIDRVAFEMSDRKIGSAVVVTENGEPHGIFTSTDALNALIEITRGDSGY